jgi:hypothetical protein
MPGAKTVFLSPAARALIGGGGLQADIARLAGLSPSQISRSLAGLRPLRPEVLEVIRRECGPVVADRIAVLAAEARAERRRERAGGAAGRRP